MYPNCTCICYLLNSYLIKLFYSTTTNTHTHTNINIANENYIILQIKDLH